MKHLLRLFTLAIITSILFSSCGKQMSITKRKYNKGYYVSHSHNKKQLKYREAVAKNKSIEADQLQPVLLNPKIVLPSDNNGADLSANALKPADNNSIKISNGSKAQAAPVANKKYYQVKKLEQLMPSSVYTKQLKNKLSADAGDDALSLIWIIIVVVLILYLLGLLFGGFGLGGAIHVLAVIALVLLILWLLRVI